MASSRGHAAFGVTLRALTVAGLAVSAYVHFKLSKTYDPVGSKVTQGELFRIEAIFASLAALWLVLSDRVAAWLPAVTVAAFSLAAVLTYRYVNVGAIGPIPNMYEPTWQSLHNLKLISAYAEGAAAFFGVAGLIRAGLDA